ncbi:amyloid-beta A4 precursor protein-binding family A member 3 [Sardina pilchardus]|uniref:amyloid-beta A4 precursor protein-binding family A member 3 n=1 Tax=Sardina pilchardus TaxID=27697 RepID=UPI002E113D54
MAEEAGATLMNGEEGKHRDLLQAEVQALMMNVPPASKNNEANIPLHDSPAPSQSEEIVSQPNSGLVDVDHSSTNPAQENSRKADLEDLDSFSLIEPPPLDWRSDSSSEAGCIGEADSEGFIQTDSIDIPEDAASEDGSQLAASVPEAPLLPCQVDVGNHNVGQAFEQSEEQLLQNEVLKGQTVEQEVEEEEEEEQQQEKKNEDQEGPANEQCGPPDVDHSRIHTLLSHLQLVSPSPAPDSPSPEPPQATLLDFTDPTPYDTLSSPGPVDVPQAQGTAASGLLFTESHQKDLLGLLEGPSSAEERPQLSPPCLSYGHLSAGVDAVVSVSYSHEDAERYWDGSHGGHNEPEDETHALDYSGEDSGLLWQRRAEPPAEEEGEELAASGSDMEAEARPAYKDVPGPCDPDDLLDGVIFGAKYLGSTQLKSDKNPSTSARMAQAQEAVDRIKAPEGESQPMTEVDLFISTQRIKVLNADTQEAMMDHSLQMISYIADIGNIVVLMARRKPAGRKGSDGGQAANPAAAPKKCWMLCHVFISDDAQVIAQAIGQAFAVAYQQFMQTNGIKPDEYDDFLSTQELYNGDLVHFSCSENIREVCIRKAIGEILGLAVVESGWGSILPTVVVANLLHGGPAERSGELSIGDRIMSVNGTSLVGLPITTCHTIIRDLKNQAQVKLSIVHCPPVTMAIIKRPDPKYQLGFSVEDGIICSLMRGGIAERGGIRVGHRIIEINGQSVVATPHDKIIHILTNAVGEIHLKTMPASTYRLLTGQEQPVFL